MFWLFFPSFQNFRIAFFLAFFVGYVQYFWAHVVSTSIYFVFTPRSIPTDHRSIDIVLNCLFVLHYSDVLIYHCNCWCQNPKKSVYRDLFEALGCDISWWLGMNWSEGCRDQCSYQKAELGEKWSGVFFNSYLILLIFYFKNKIIHLLKVKPFTFK